MNSVTENWFVCAGVSGWISGMKLFSIHFLMPNLMCLQVANVNCVIEMMKETLYRTVFVHVHVPCIIFCRCCLLFAYSLTLTTGPSGQTLSNLDEFKMDWSNL